MKRSQFLREIRGLSRDDFHARYGHPFLMVTDARADDAQRAFQTIVVDGPAPEPAELDEPEIYPVVRPDEGEGIVTLGRARNMVIVLDSPAVSKLHAYFRREIGGERWTIADAGSTNGTWVNGKRLGKNEPVSLHDGDAITIGKYFVGTFLLPEGAYARLVLTIAGA